MLAHPFHAQSSKEAEEMEMQAMGRINRIGQKAASLMIWRVMTEGTIEQELYEHHGQEPPVKRRR